MGTLTHYRIKFLLFSLIAMSIPILTSNCCAFTIKNFFLRNNELGSNSESTTITKCQNKNREDIENIKIELEKIEKNINEMYNEMRDEIVASKIIALIGVISLTGAAILLLAKMNVEHNIMQRQHFDGL